MSLVLKWKEEGIGAASTIKKRILYIDPVKNETIGKIKDYLGQKSGSETVVEVISLSHGPRHLEYYSYGAIVVPQILKIIKKAENEGFDGAVIGCFYDLGLREAREISETIVVTAPAESSFHIASIFGQKFSIIVTEKKVIPLMRENLFKYRFQNHLASFRELGLGVLELQRNPEETKNRLKREAQIAIKRDGAEVIILGCTMQYGFYKELQEQLGVPVIDAACAALNFAEFLIDLRERHGWFFNKKNEYLPPPREEIENWNLSELL